MGDFPHELFVSSLMAASFVGVGLALYYDQPAWLIMSAAALCVIYAG